LLGLARASPLEIGVEIQLVAWRYLPGNPRRRRRHCPLLSTRRPRQVVGVEARALGRVVVDARPLRLAAVVAIRLENPDFVFPDRTARGPAGVVFQNSLGRRRQPAGDELIAQVVADQLVVGEEATRGELPGIAARLWNHVHSGAGGGI